MYYLPPTGFWCGSLSGKIGKRRTNTHNYRKSLNINIGNPIHLEKIGATCDTRNIASQHVLEKNGFVQTARREKDFMQKKVWRDTFRYDYMPDLADTKCQTPPTQSLHTQ